VIRVRIYLYVRSVLLSLSRLFRSLEIFSIRVSRETTGHFRLPLQSTHVPNILKRRKASISESFAIAIRLSIFQKCPTNGASPFPEWHIECCRMLLLSHEGWKILLPANTRLSAFYLFRSLLNARRNTSQTRDSLPERSPITDYCVTAGKWLLLAQISSFSRRTNEPSMAPES